MATRAESLIRQFCEQRGNEVRAEATERRSRVPSKVPVSKLPARLRAAVNTYRRLAPQLARVEKILSDGGLSAYEIKRGQKTVSNPRQTAENERLAEQRDSRLTAVSRLQQSAYIAVMDAKPREQRKVIEKLQRELARI